MPATKATQDALLSFAAEAMVNEAVKHALKLEKWSEGRSNLGWKETRLVVPTSGDGGAFCFFPAEKDTEIVGNLADVQQVREVLTQEDLEVVAVILVGEQ